MTFTDAAIEVLRLVGKPLHYKEITDIAIERNLLSHVGKSPEVTMGARLAALMKKETGDNPLVRVKPGVFGLKDWDPSKTKAAKAGKKAKGEEAEEVSEEIEIESASDDDDDVLVDVDVQADAGEPARPVGKELEAAPPPAPAARDSRAGRRREPSPPQEDVEQGPDDQMRAEAVLGAGEMFDEEEDDDEPILGGAEDPARAAAGEVGSDGRRRRRRRRRGRGPEVTPSEGGLPAYTATPVEARQEAAPREARDGGGGAGREPREGGAREPREGGGGREPREGGGGREPREGWGRGADRGADRDRIDPSVGREVREGRGPQILELVASDQIAGEDLAGRDMADVVASLLGTFDRNGGPVSLRHLAETLQRKGKPGGDVQLLSSQIAAAIRADNARRAASGSRPRFRFAGGRVGSTDWILGGDLLLAERDALAAVERYREASRRAFARRVTELPGHAFVELVVLALERFGIGALRSVRRPGGSGNEAHFAGKLRGPGDDFAVGVVVRRDGREIGRERVTELRGALHHYGNAQSGFLFTSGQILSGAREEAASTGVAPVSLHDGASFARLCEEHEVAVVKSRLAIAIPDVDLLEALRAS